MGGAVALDNLAPIALLTRNPEGDLRPASKPEVGSEPEARRPDRAAPDRRRARLRFANTEAADGWEHLSR
ncbi:hypothetical protein [Kitasatospora azatica]|uniref:hypothetical protein n=1 Tax=Kitasatospora azatica TaxID=58347 RepID=UPI00055CDC9A|nr:hypothetical protein [Kitasatospora azatica]